MRLVFIGGGKMAKELYCWMLQSSVLQDYSNLAYVSNVKSNLQMDYLGEISPMNIRVDDKLILAIGDVKYRREAIDNFADHKDKFVTFVHPTSIISEEVSLGVGAVISPFCIISNDTRIGDFLFMNAYSSIGHDCMIGDNMVMSPYAAITGSCELGSDVYMGTHSTSIPSRRIGNKVKVSAGSVVTKHVPEESIVFGSMGKIVKL